MTAARTARLAVLQRLQDRDILVDGSLINMNIGAAFSLAIDRVLYESRDPSDMMIIMESDQTSEIDLVREIIRKIQEEQQDIVIALPLSARGRIPPLPVPAAGLQPLCELVIAFVLSSGAAGQGLHNLYAWLSPGDL